MNTTETKNVQIGLSDGRNLETVILDLESRIAVLESTPVNPDPEPVPPSNRIILDTFETLRDCPGTDRKLFEIQSGGSTGMVNQTLLVENNKLRVDVGATDPGDGNGGSIYWHCYTKANGQYLFPDGFLQNFIMNGVWSPAVNTLRMCVETNKDFPYWAINGNGTLGNYIKNQANTDGNFQGQHWYNRFGCNYYAGKKCYMEFNSQPQTRVATSGSTVFANEPELNQYTENIGYFDGMTRFYWNLFENFDVQNSSWWFSEMEFLEKPLPIALRDGNSNWVGQQLPVSLVSSVCVTATNFGGYDLSFCGPKNTPKVDYEVYTSLQSMRSNGIESGTLLGQCQSVGSAYTSVLFQVPTLAEQDRFFAIRPVGMTEFYEIEAKA